MKQANEIAAELLMIESRSKGPLMKQAAAVIMGQAHIIGQLHGQCQKLLAEVERCREAMPTGHPHNDHERLSRAADILGSYCATHICDACPQSLICWMMGIPLPEMLANNARAEEKPKLLEQFASRR